MVAPSRWTSRFPRFWTLGSGEVEISCSPPPRAVAPWPAHHGARGPAALIVPVTEDGIRPVEHEREPQIDVTAQGLLVVKPEQGCVQG